MSTRTAPHESVNSRSLLLSYALVLIAVMAIIQIVIAVAGGVITVLSGILTGVVALGIVVWLWRNYRALIQIRFGFAIAHVLAYVIVTTSFNLHVIARVLGLAGGEDGYRASAELLLTTPWFGATLIMSAAWGCGLLIHLIGATLGRGWEE